jgi:hypothetical protein
LPIDEEKNLGLKRVNIGLKTKPNNQKKKLPDKEENLGLKTKSKEGMLGSN